MPNDKAKEELVKELGEIWNCQCEHCYGRQYKMLQVILAREKRIIERVLEYTEHDKRCLCSQWRRGEPTEDGRYRTLYGYGKQEKWYFDKEEPECSCGLTSICKEYLEGGK